jgi:DGQHR domain-containing protein
MIPNALVVAFEPSVAFVPSSDAGDGASVGVLRVPIVSTADGTSLPGWIVDGQQRAAAIRDARVESYMVFVTAFIAESQEEQRSQFILVNNTKPLPKGLIHELLPDTAGALPSTLERRRFPAMLLARLNHDEDSPLRGRIRTSTNSEGVVKDNSILRMLENSLRDGALFLHWDPRTQGGEVDAMLVVLKNFWRAVSEVFNEDWDLPPKRSRLLHGVGVMSLGFVMDAIADRHRGPDGASVEVFRSELQAIKGECRWSSGYWDFGPGAQRRWNELQNTGKDIQLLANFLLTVHRSKVWDGARA